MGGTASQGTGQHLRDDVGSAPHLVGGQTSIISVTRRVGAEACVEGPAQKPEASDMAKRRIENENEPSIPNRAPEVANQGEKVGLAASGPIETAINLKEIGRSRGGNQDLRTENFEFADRSKVKETPYPVKDGGRDEGETPDCPQDEVSSIVMCRILGHIPDQAAGCGWFTGVMVSDKPSKILLSHEVKTVAGLIGEEIHYFDIDQLELRSFDREDCPKGFKRGKRWSKNEQGRFKLGPTGSRIKPYISYPIEGRSYKYDFSPRAWMVHIDNLLKCSGKNSRRTGTMAEGCCTGEEDGELSGILLRIYGDGPLQINKNPETADRDSDKDEPSTQNPAPEVADQGEKVGLAMSEPIGKTAINFEEIGRSREANQDPGTDSRRVELGDGEEGTTSSDREKRFESLQRDKLIEPSDGAILASLTETALIGEE